MSETPAEPATTPAAPAAADAPTPAEVASDDTLAALREDVKELAGAFRGLLAGPRAAGPAAAGPDAGIGPEVAAEVQKLRAAEDRAARAKGQAGRLDQIEQAVKKITERKPREYRRVTRFMGWPDQDDMQ